MAITNLGLHSWQQFVDTAAQRLSKDALPGARHSSTSDDRAHSWDLGVGLADAVRMAHTGWQDGADAVGRALDRVTPAVEALPDWSLDVCGAFPCVPALLAGEPECVWRLEENRRCTRRLALVVGSMISSRVTAQEVATYARAVAATARAIEASGIDVAIYSIDSTAAKTNCCFAVTVREYGEPMDLAKIAFAFHPAWSRRINFAWREITQAAVYQGLASGGYGRCRPVTREAADTVLGDLGAVMAVLPDPDVLSTRGALADSRIDALIELFRTETDAAIRAAGG